MSHLTDLARQVTDAEDAWATTRNREAGERARSAAAALARDAKRAAERLAAELDEHERAEIRAVYDNDPHGGTR
ncbi:hypothetical protein [Catellatospora sp. NPDC049609]|uniref:hypothetical protein n=1 Tax=Catellatospora sp. NPDC049609 TaxID=3155505 RepID=UPI0034430E57